MVASQTALDRTARDGVGLSLHAPFTNASLRLPGPGARVQVGPAALTLSSGPLYYLGAAGLAAAGVVEWPLALALGTGLTFGPRLVHGLRTHRHTDTTG